MSTSELYCKGARVWIPHPELVWEGAELAEDFKEKVLHLEFQDGRKDTIKVDAKDKLPPLRNPDILIGENDLTSLSYLHEPAVLYNLNVRFCNQNAIYTYCGIVLVAINPYEELPIYGNDTIMAYRGQAMGDLDPHIFAVSEEAYTQMERESQNQSIIVSGESGAGKTVSAKYAMRYFATVGGSATETQVEKKVLASNPIMEAIGNAKTTRNDNSSRFGKYIEIDFNQKYHIIGANMRTYLLEKSRVVFQASEERNYHIFYQLCASSKLEELKDLYLGNQDDFHYTNLGESAAISGVDDAQYFHDTRNAFTLLGFSEKQQMSMFRILSSILHLGNVKVMRGEDADSSAVSLKDKHLKIVCELLGINCEQMATWLCHRKIQSMREIIMKELTRDQAIFARDALAKHIYSQLFEWIVVQINKSLASSKKIHKFIGVLDIYGFETFEINSFEQFCINYANEKLQQQFNMHVFKLEQEEYVREKIEWKFIDFYDNQPCIDLIESKLGILDLLDEECKMPKGTDETWCQKLVSQCKKWKHFEKPRLSNTAFIIHHFADNVKYEVGGFLEKNRDTVMEEHINILKASEYELVAELFEEGDNSSSKLKPVAQVRAAAPAVKGGKKQHKKTVGSQFRDSLGLLMSTLNATTPHYVRCIKPNDQKSSFDFEPRRAVQQLRACGVLETIRISAAGYPSRWSYQDFLNRYRVLTKSKDIVRSDLQTTCKTILENLITEEDKFQFGKTKIFFRAGQVAYLEKLRADKLKSCAIMLQKNIRGWLQKKRYQKIRNTAIGIQRYTRGLIARRYANFLKRTKAAIIIQKNVRRFVCYRVYKRLSNTALRLQAHARGVWARQKYQQMRKDAAATTIQKYVRGWLARLKYQKTIKLIIKTQAAVRRWFARKEFKKLKIEARSVEHVKKLNKGLENKIISQQQRIEELLREKKGMQAKQVDTKEVAAQLEHVRFLEGALKDSNRRCCELEEALIVSQTELRVERDEKQDIISEKDLLKTQKDEIVEQLNQDNLLLKKDVNNLNEKITIQEKSLEEKLQSRHEGEKRLLLEEFSAERAAYQKLLKENARLEQRYENLEGEIVRMKSSGHTRTHSNVSLVSSRSDATEPVRDDASDVHDEDVGYGSIRSKDKDGAHTKLDDVKWDDHSPLSKDASPDEERTSDISETLKDAGDVTLLLKLQHKLKSVELEKAKLEKKIETLEDSPEKEHFLRDSLRLKDLETENTRLKDNVHQLRHALSKGDQSDKVKKLLDHTDALEEELEKRREECVELKTALANVDDPRYAALGSYIRCTEPLNEDGELQMAFESQKVLIRHLEEELQKEKDQNTKDQKELRHELQKLQEDNERQQKLLSQNLKKTPQARTEAVLQHEINRLTSENLDLREKNDNLTEQLKKLKKQLKLYAKKIKDSGTELVISEGMEMSKEKADNMPLVKHKEVNYLGMFEYKKEDEQTIIKNLIYELRPKTAVRLVPGLPAYILFMCIRHTDYINDDEKVRSLLNNTVHGIKKVIKKRHEDLEYTTVWLANTCRLLHNLKQYSGDEAFQSENSPKQNEHCLRNFDLSEYRQVLSDVAVWIYQAVIKIMEEKVQSYIVPAVLEHEAIPGISGNKPSGMRRRSSSVVRDDAPIDPQRALDVLLQELSSFYKTLSLHGIDPEIISQVFKQLFYFICAGALNNLLLRKDMCHWSKGMQIRYNLSHLEQWCRDTVKQSGEVTETLQPIIQASQLLQARKSDEDVASISVMCEKLTSSQIIKLLNLYTPADEFEERVPTSFIRKMQVCLVERDTKQATDNPGRPVGTSMLLMDSKYAFPIRFPFYPSDIRLEDIVIPDCLSLSMLRKI